MVASGLNQGITFSNGKVQLFPAREATQRGLCTDTWVTSGAEVTVPAAILDFLMWASTMALQCCFTAT